jgi:hypothetical protein
MTLSALPRARTLGRAALAAAVGGVCLQGSGFHIDLVDSV